MQYKIDQIMEQEDLLFSQQARKVIDEDQFARGMKRAREERAELTKKHMEVEQEIKALETSAVSIPSTIFTDPKEMSLETMKELAHETLERIVVWPDKITVVLKRVNLRTGEHYAFDIGRVRTRNSRDLPFWKARIDSQVITPESKVGVTYFYPTTRLGLYRKIAILYHDRHLEVLSLGDNVSVDKKKSRNPTLPLQTSFDRMLIRDFGPPPTYGRTLELKSNVFYSDLIVEQFPNMDTKPQKLSKKKEVPLPRLPDDWSPFK